MDISVSVPTIHKVTILLVRKTGVPRLLLVQQRARYIRNNPLLLRSRSRWKYRLPKLMEGTDGIHLSAYWCFSLSPFNVQNVTISYEERSTWNFPSLAKRQRYLLYQKKNIPAIFFICQVKTLKHEKIGTDHVGTTFLHPIVKLGPKL